jgi:phage shock protein PspC (stress-responsive transcriptional regulator)
MAEKKVNNKKQAATETESKKQESDNGTQQTAPKKLYRSKRNAVVAGVSAGLAEYFNIDPAIVRLIFVLATVFGGSGVLVYIILWIILPQEEQGTIGSHDTVHDNVAEIRGRAEEFAEGFRGGSREIRTRTMVGYIFIGLGVIFVLQNFGLFRADIFWPLVLVVVGLFILR